MKPGVLRWGSRTALACLLGGVISLWSCAGGSDPLPSPGFGMLSGQTVLVLPVQHVESTASGWIGDVRSAREAARQADAEIHFALSEQAGRATWVLPEEQVRMLRRRPSITVDPYTLSTDEVRDEGGRLRRIHDPLYGEIRALAALFDTRLAIWPLEVVRLDPESESGSSVVGIRTLLLDARGGDVLWQGLVRGEVEGTGPGALASAAQAFARRVSP